MRAPGPITPVLAAFSSMMSPGNAAAGQDDPALASANSALVSGLRWTFGVVLMLACILAGGELAWRGPGGPALFFVEFTQVVVILAVLGWLRHPNADNKLLVVGVGACAVTYLCAASIGMLGGSTLTAQLLFCALALTTSALLPWGVRPQLVTVSIAGIAVLFQALWLQRMGEPDTATAAQLTTSAVLLGSLAVAWQIDRYRQHSVHATMMWAETERALKTMQSEMERRIHERTAHLEATNLDLESFSYSVSHDLRAPLRAVSGLVEVLMEDYREQLDAQAIHMIDRVGAATRRMRDLIEGLLEMSRHGAETLVRQHVDLVPMIREIHEELLLAQPNRVVELCLPPRIDVYGDPRILRPLLTNLLANAWKFSATREVTRIQVGILEGVGEDGVFVRDNGVGFDPAVAVKLFQPFLRFHPSYEGLGIGLATAARIVHRHGGRIWAEGCVDVGATFYFTLPHRAAAAASA